MTVRDDLVHDYETNDLGESGRLRFAELVTDVAMSLKEPVGSWRPPVTSNEVSVSAI